MLTPFTEPLGIEVQTRERRAKATTVTFSELPGAPVLPTNGQIKLTLNATRAEVLAREADGSPALTRVAYGKGTIYFLTIPDGTYKTFTVERHVYDATIWACGDDSSATLDILTQLQLNFPACTYAPNNGEPSLEKVHLTDTPTKDQAGDFNLLKWRFQY
jgi:hypothetical protein